MSNRHIVILSLSLNAAYMAALFGFVACRVTSGLSPMPEGYGFLMMASAATVPALCGALGNFLRLRQHA
ncbi:hypothetical protein AYO42_00860 [Rhizomicrobium sp. SCGC AG-212-E05]|nr:hypothetical protein AYO42_00860 [Rhizomicrobium sp. SCGC AG-212-E05]